MIRLIIILWVIGMLCACEEEDFYPEGLYGYQVERLLSGDALKIWKISEFRIDGELQPIENCQDSLQLIFYPANSGVVVYQLTSCSLAVSDTIFSGNLKATTRTTGNKNVFTDTLIFTGTGASDFYVKEITSKILSFERRMLSEKHDFTYQTE